jgi:hypothetical protein
LRRIGFGQLPEDGSGLRRPMIGVAIERHPAASLPCLIDTGTSRTRLPGWMANLIGFDMYAADGIQLGLGGQIVKACPAQVTMTTVAGTLPTTVWFCRGWHSPFGLLGQEGFLDHYRLTLDVREGWFALEPSG